MDNRHIPVKDAKLVSVLWKFNELWVRFSAEEADGSCPTKEYSASVLFRMDTGTGPILYWIYGRVAQVILRVDRDEFNAKTAELAAEWRANEQLRIP